MGSATNAILAYGYDLGGPCDKWNLQETDRYGSLHGLDWYDEDADFIEAAETQLLAVIAQFTEPWTRDAHRTGYHERKEAAKASIGVRLGQHCSRTAPGYLLAVDITTAHRGSPVAVDIDDLNRRRLAYGWDLKLLEALAALHLTPTEYSPAWLLASFAEGF